MKQKILIIDDDKAILETIAGILGDEGFQAQTAESGEEGIAILKKAADIDAILLDVWMKGIDGLQTLQWIQTNRENCPVVMMSGHATLETAVKATKNGAYDFLEKPLSYDKLLITLSRALRESSLLVENTHLKKHRDFFSDTIIGEHPHIKKIRDQIEILAPSNSWVLIHGENGTGKELVARQIHLQSNRKQRPFVEMNCAAIPEELIESTLFGHEKGSFTGAHEKKTGKFDQANGGTLFLDEIGDMSLNTQAKILRVLQELRFERVGGSDMIHVDVRIIAASNKKLEEEIQKNNFREDLFYRLNVIPVNLPPLRERKEDIPLLIQNFIAYFAETNNYPAKTLSGNALEVLKHYRWPGNIRELKNIVERMMILVTEKVIEVEHIPPAILLENKHYAEKIGRGKPFANDYKTAKENFEKEFLASKLGDNGWNVSKTAESIGMERSHLHKKIKQYNLEAGKND